MHVSGRLYRYHCSTDTGTETRKSIGISSYWYYPTLHFASFLCKAFQFCVRCKSLSENVVMDVLVPIAVVCLQSNILAVLGNGAKLL